MITTKADKLLRSLIDAGLSLTDFTLLTIKVLNIQHSFKIDNQDRHQRDRLRQQDKLREQNYLEQQIKEEEQRKIKGLKKLRELGYVTSDDIYQIEYNKPLENLNQYEIKDKTDQILFPYIKQINPTKQKQYNCCLAFNIDYDLRLNQQALIRACRRAKRNIYELRAERFNRPEYRSILSIETVTLHNKLKEIIREINKIFSNLTITENKRDLQELLTYINQYEGNIDLLMCQMQYEPKVKETILFSPVTTDILDRMNLILYSIHILANQISTNNSIEKSNENLHDNLSNNIPIKSTYIIKIKTNDDISSSLSNETNVKIKLYGTYNKSSDIQLIQSINNIKWQSGQIDLFNIELNYLGDIYAIEIEHDSQYSLWKVDWIDIIDDGANNYHFPLNSSLEKYSNEKKSRFIIQRDIGLVQRLPLKPLKQLKSYKQIGFSTYTIQVKTGKQPNKLTDSFIFFQLKGENGNFSDQLYSANSAFKSSVFEPDQLDTFYLIWPYLGKINSAYLSIQSQGIQPLWFCEYITVEDSQTGDKYNFIVNQLFDGSNPDDPNLKTHLTIYPENIDEEDNKKENEKPSYLIKLKTGENGLSNMSILPSINIILKGEKGTSEPYVFKSLDNKRKIFQDNQTDEFILSSKYYVGPIKTLQISTNEQIDKWFIETIIIRDIIQGKDYIFPIYKWINTHDGINNLVIQPINERKADYIVYIRTKTSELKGPDRTIKLFIQGNKGKHEIELNSPITMFNTFQPGRKDEYYIENMKSLGDLQSIELDITHPNIVKLGLDYIEIKDVTTNESYRFNINRMLDSKNPKMLVKAEPILRSNQNPTKSQSTHSQKSLLNSTNPMSNKQSFDQLTTAMPQGAQRPINLNDKEKNSKHDINNSKENIYQIKLKTFNKEFLDKNAKFQIELIDDKQQSEIIIENNIESLQNDKINTFTINTKKSLENLKNIKLSIIESKSNKKNFYQPEFIEIFHLNTNKTYRIDYKKTDFLNSEKNQLELIKSLRQLSNTNTLETNQPQGTSPTMILSTKNSISNNPSKKSLLNSIEISQNLSNETNSLSNKTIHNSIRQIRPGDRVKNNSKKNLNNYQSISSLHEVDWYRRSIEKSNDYPDKLKQIQLITDKHISQSKFQQQKSHIINQKINDLSSKSIESVTQNSNNILTKQNLNISSSNLDNEKPSNISSSLTNSNQISQSINSIPISTNTSDEIIKQNNNNKQSQLLNSNINQYNLQPNIQTSSNITIHTIATKSDSDLNLPRKSINSHGSKHSLQDKTLLSPNISKKSRQNRRREHQQNILTNISDTSNINKLNKDHTSSTNNKYLSKEISDVQYTSPSSSKKSQSDNILLPIKSNTSNNIQENHNKITTHYRSYSDQPLIEKTSNIQSSIRSTSSQGIKSIESQHSSKHSSNTSTSTTNSSLMTQNHHLPNEISNDKYLPVSKKQLITTKISSNLPLKPIEVDHMSTVYEESESSTTTTIPNILTSSLSEQEWLESSSNFSSNQQNFPLNNQIKYSSKEKSLSNKTIQSSYLSSIHQENTIDTKTNLTSIKSNNSIDFEFRVQISNESELDGTNEPVSIELTNIKGYSIKIPLINSINNVKPFQKGQLDIFHFQIPNNFHTIKKINLFLPKTTKDSLHILYCELQNRQTMNTFHFPIEKWLGEKNTFNVEMYVNDNNNSLF